MLAIGMPMFIVATHHGSQHEHLIGDVWDRGDGLGYNVSLILGKNGQYIARWLGARLAGFRHVNANAIVESDDGIANVGSGGGARRSGLTFHARPSFFSTSAGGPSKLVSATLPT